MEGRGREERERERKKIGPPVTVVSNPHWNTLTQAQTTSLPYEHILLQVCPCLTGTHRRPARGCVVCAKEGAKENAKKDAKQHPHA